LRTVAIARQLCESDSVIFVAAEKFQLVVLYIMKLGQGVSIAEVHRVPQGQHISASNLKLRRIEGTIPIPLGQIDYQRKKLRRSDV